MLSHGMDIQEPPADPEISEILTFIPVDLNKLDAMNKTMRLKRHHPVPNGCTR